MTASSIVSKSAALMPCGGAGKLSFLSERIELADSIT
jgi:hypothetical protein